MSETTKKELHGVICAIVTPLKDGKLEIKNFQRHIQTLAEEGCDGLLLMGTTGEGPSMGFHERGEVIEAALEVSGDMSVLAGTGCASLTDTIAITRQAFELGVDGVVVIPPFYFKDVSDQGLSAYYHQLFDGAVPDDGRLLVYHIPQVSAVPISFALLEDLLAYAGDRMAGIKDSSGDLEHGLALCKQFPQLRIFFGNDKLLWEGLKAGGAGCITAATNVLTPLAAQVYQAFKAGEDAAEPQELLSASRSVLDKYKPYPPSMKALLAARYGTPGWEMRPPLDPMPETELQALRTELATLNLPDAYAWLS